MAADFAKLVTKCDEEIRAGRADLVAKHVASLVVAQIPRQYRLPLAAICRRAALGSLGLKILTSIVHIERGSHERPATAHELAEYAFLLQKNGSTEEALRILERVDLNAVPEASLYRAYCRFARWEHEQAIPQLESYLRSGPAPYAALVARVNLAAALIVAVRHEEALAVLDANIAEARTNGHARLLGNCLELRSQVHLHARRLTECRTDLNEAARIFGSEETFDQLFVMKWRAVLEAQRTHQIEPLLEFRGKALRRRHWESVRETDFWRLKIEPNKNLFDHLVFGTPFISYRARVARELGLEPRKHSFLYGQEGAPCLDLLSGDINGLDGGARLRAGKQTHQLLEVLLRDFYRPLRLGSLFAELFPGDHFDAFSSPNRIHQLLFRARTWLADNGVPVSILESDGDYSLQVDGSFAFMVPLERREIDGQKPVLEKLLSTIGRDREFSAKQAREAASLSQAAFQRLAAWAVDEGYLERIGSGPKTRYRASDPRDPSSSSAA